MSLEELEQKLLLAQARMKKVESEHLYEEYPSTFSALLETEREVAAAKGEPYAVPSDFPIEWDIEAPSPHIMNGLRTLLTFVVSEVNPHWDGKYIKAENPDAGSVPTLALVEFKRVASVKIGSPHDEVAHGHPLNGKGMDGYSAQIVMNSPWRAELEAINKVDDYFNPESWRHDKHYIFWFRNATFECVAMSYTVELYEESMSQMLMRMANRLDN